MSMPSPTRPNINAYSRAWLVAVAVCALPLMAAWWVTIKMSVDFYAVNSGGGQVFSTFGVLFMMWAMMMAAMMLPSVFPATLLFARVNREWQKTGAFVCGYLLAWLAFSLAVAGGQWWLMRWDGLDENLALSSNIAQGALLGFAGVYQFSSFKKACLRWCAEPVTFFLLHWKNGRAGAMVMGLKNGGFCLGCCWVLMLLLFVGGVMELRWIFLLAFFALAEKILPLAVSEITGKIIGGILLLAGLWSVF